MKKIVAFSFFCVMLFLFCACGTQNFEDVNRALSAAASADAADVSIKTEVYISVNGKSDSFSSESSAKMTGLQTKSPSFSAKTDVNLFGETVAASVYYKDTFYYVVTASDAVKLASGELIEKTDFVSEWKKAMCPFSKKDLKSAEISVSEDAVKTAVIAADPVRFSEEYSALLHEWKEFLLDRYVVAYTEPGFSLRNASYTVVFQTEADVLQSFTASAEVEIHAKNISGESVSLSAQIENTVICHSMGASVTPEIPEGYASFPLTDGRVLDPYLVSKQAIESVLSLSDIHADVTWIFDAESGGWNEEILMKYDLRVAGAKTEAPVFDYNLKISEPFGDTEETVYFADGYYYVESTDFAALKCPKTKENDLLYGYEVLIHDLMQTFSPSDFEGVEVQKKKDGMRSVLLPLSAERLGELYPTFLNRMTEAYIGAAAVDISKIKVLLLTDDKGNLKEFTMSFLLSIAIEDDFDIDCEIEYQIAFHDFGAPVTPVPPKNFENYPSLAEINENAFEKIGAAIRKMASCDDMRVSQASHSESLIGYQSVSLDQEYTLEAMHLKTSPTYAYRVETDFSGMTFSEKVYFENGTYYIISDLLEEPIQTSEMYAENYNALTQIYSVLQELPDSFLEKAMTDTDDSGHYLYVELTLEEFAQMYPNLMKKISAEAIGVPVFDLKAEELYIEIHADHEGDLRRYDIGYTFSFFAEIDGEAYASYVSSYASFSFSNSITPVTLTPPEGYRDFRLYDTALLT